MAEQQAHPIEIYVATIKGKEIQELIQKSLPKSIPDQKFTAAVIGAIKANAQVFVDCDRQSVYNSIIEAARKGLIPDGKQGALVPFNTKVKQNGQEVWIKKCQFMIMPEGIIDSLAKVGITIYAESVYKKDTFKFWSDDKGQHVHHEFDPFSDRGERIGAFSSAMTKDGTCYVEAMGMADIKKVMAASKQKDQQGNMTGPWKVWADRMEQKSCMHRVCKRTPNVDIGDDDEYTDRVVTVVPPTDQSLPVAQTAGAPTTASAARTDTADPKRPKALQRILDSETGEILGTTIDQQPEPEPVPVHATVQHNECSPPADVQFNPDRTPF